MKRKSWIGKYQCTHFQDLLHSYSNPDYYIGERIDTEQWNRRENPEIDPHKYDQMTFYKSGTAIHWSKDTFSTNVDGTTR